MFFGCQWPVVTHSLYSISHSALNAFYFSTLHLFFTVRIFPISNNPIKLRCNAMCVVFSDMRLHGQFFSTLIQIQLYLVLTKQFFQKSIYRQNISFQWYTSFYKTRLWCFVIILFFPLRKCNLHAVHCESRKKKKWCSFHTLNWVENTFSHFHETVFIYVARFIVVKQTRRNWARDGMGRKKMITFVEN